MNHNPTDVQLEMAKTYWALYKERESCRAAVQYDADTSFCSNCPKTADRREVFSTREVDIAYSCCKDEDDYQKSDLEYIQLCTDMMNLLKEFLGDEADHLLEAARKA